MSYAAPIWSLRHLDASRIDAAAPADRGPGAIREGVAYVRARPDLLLVLGLVFFAGTFGLNFQITSALMATEVFGKGPEEFGLLGTFLAVGSLTGALLAARRTQVRHRLVVGSALAFGASVMLAGLMPSYLTFALLAPVTGLTALTFITSANTYMQLHTDAGVRGRVMALYLMIFMGGTPDRRARSSAGSVRSTAPAGRCWAAGCSRSPAWRSRRPSTSGSTGRGASVTATCPNRSSRRRQRHFDSAVAHE